MEQLLVSRKEAAGVLGVSVKTVQTLTRKRQLAVKRIGRRRLITRASLERFASTDTSNLPTLEKSSGELMHAGT